MKNRLLEKELEEALNKIKKLEAEKERITKNVEQQKELKVKLKKELEGIKYYGEKK